MKVWALKGSTVVLLFVLCQLKAPETVARGDSWECKLGAEVFSSMHTYSFIYVFKCIYIYIQKVQMSVNKSPCVASWNPGVLTWLGVIFHFCASFLAYPVLTFVGKSDIRHWLGSRLVAGDLCGASQRTRHRALARTGVSQMAWQPSCATDGQPGIWGLVCEWLYIFHLTFLAVIGNGCACRGWL